MYDTFDQAGFEDSVLNSQDDFEPYGYAAPQLLPVAAAVQQGNSWRRLAHERVIEAEILSQSSMVGC